MSDSYNSPHVQHFSHPICHLVGTSIYEDLNTFCSIWLAEAEPEDNTSRLELYFIAWRFASEGMGNA